MDSIVTKIQRFFKQGNVVTNFILINVCLFLLFSIVSIACLLFNLPWGTVGGQYIELPSNLSMLLHRPWTLLTYMFFHRGVWHILFNMLWLYWFGNLFLYSFSAKHLRGLYLLGGLLGGLLFVLAYNTFPYFGPMVQTSYLLGASASVLAIVVAAAVRNPNYSVRLLIFGSIKLKYIAIATVLLSFLMIDSNNAGGNIAHLGGAFAGWLFAFCLSKGVDITAWINGVIDFFISWFSKKRRSAKKHRMKYRQNEKMQDYEYNSRKRKQEKNIDSILEKLKRSGYASLSDEEKRTLFNAGK